MPTTSLPVIVLLISSIGWGLTWLPLKFLSSMGMEGLSLVLIAFGAAAIVLMPLTIRQWPTWRGNKRFLVLITIFGGFANISFQTAIFHGDVIRVMILFYLLPAWSVLGGYLFLNEQIDRKRLITLTSALLGAFIILGGPEIFDAAPSWIDLLAIGSGLSFAMNNIVFRYSEQLPLTGKVNAAFVGCALMALIAITLNDDKLSTVSSMNIFWSMLYGIIWLMLITYGTQWGVERLEAGRASILIIMELVVAIISAAIILGETMSQIELLGGMLIIVAALIETFRTEITSITSHKPSHS